MRVAPIAWARKVIAVAARLQIHLVAEAILAIELLW